MNQFPQQQEDNDLTDDQQNQIPPRRQSTNFQAKQCPYCRNKYHTHAALGGHVQKMHHREQSKKYEPNVIKKKRITRQGIGQ